MPPTRLVLTIRQHSEALWFWLLTETRHGQRVISGYTRTEEAARAAAHRYTTILWPDFPVDEAREERGK